MYLSLALLSDSIATSKRKNKKKTIATQPTPAFAVGPPPQQDAASLPFSGSEGTAPLLAPTSAIPSRRKVSSSPAGPLSAVNGPTKLFDVAANGQFHLADEARAVFQQIAGPVYVVVLHGKKRTGNSTLLSFFVREWYGVGGDEAAVGGDFPKGDVV